MRKSGGQPGHQGKTRELVAPERVDERRVHLPGRCGCGHVFTGIEERIGDPVTHQQYELAVTSRRLAHRRRATAPPSEDEPLV